MVLMPLSNVGGEGTSALLSAFFSRLRRNTADFLGQRACPLVEFSFLAWSEDTPSTQHKCCTGLKLDNLIYTAVQDFPFPYTDNNSI